MLGAPMNRLSVAPGCIAMALLVGVTQAFAEVCDKGKGGESWMPAHGPVWLLNPVGWPLGLIALVAGLALAATRSKWIGYGGAALLASFIAVHSGELVERHEIYRAQVEEGCRTLATDWADVGVLAVFALAYAWLGLRRHRIEVRRIMAARQDNAAAQNI